MSVPVSWLIVPIGDGKPDGKVPLEVYDALDAAAGDDHELVACVRAWAQLLAAAEALSERDADAGAYARALTFARAWATRNSPDPSPDPYPIEHPAQPPTGRGRLRWRPGYGWRRDGEPDGKPLPRTPDPPDSAFRTRTEEELQRAARERCRDAFDQATAQGPIMRRYIGRVEEEAEILANAIAWGELKRRAERAQR